jgi:hypothetical protein
MYRKKYSIMKKLIAIAICMISFSLWSNAQTLTQTVKGSVTDQTTREALVGAHIILVGSDPIKGTTVGLDGTYNLADVPVGRQSLEFRMVGYQPLLVTEILVTSGKEVIQNIALKQEATVLDEIVVSYQAASDQALNEMVALSGKQFTVEETQRYAGGLNDPARLVSSFAGVATPSVSNNGISVRGNSPSGLLWRIEGVEVPSPNHFADLTIAGAGALTVLSSQTMTNSDFLTGAFPAEYGNASSGVFDINLRSGNGSQNEHSLEAGLLGVGFATEGPFRQGSKATYLLNYRYSTLGLIGVFLPDDAGILKYQDLSFKVKMPTKNAGTFSLWSLGAYDAIDVEALEAEEWQSKQDRENSQTSMYMFASGLNHKLALNSRMFLNSSLAFSGHGLSFKEQYLDDELQAIPQSDAEKNHYKLTLQSSLTTYFGEDHFNNSGFYLNSLGYDMDIDNAESIGALPRNIIKGKGQSLFFQFYSQSQFSLSHRLNMNVGFHTQYFQLNNEFTFEPRVSVNYKLSPKSNLALGYGLHSRIEPLALYFVSDDQGNQPNRDLKLMKSNQVVLSFNSMLSDHLKLRIEPYYQYLNQVPVAADGYVSTLNITDNLFFNQVLISEGTGRNVGVDVTLERYLDNGFYYMLTGSVFDSKYTANDGIQRNTRFNKNYVVNGLIGKEWPVGRNKNNSISANVRVNYLGGNRIEAIDPGKSVEAQDVVYGETGGTLSFADNHKDTPISSFTVSYRKNKKKYSSVWSLQVLNSGQTEEFDKHIFNTNTQMVETEYSSVVIPNLSYRIEF